MYKRQALSGAYISSLEVKLINFKEDCKASGIPVITFESAISWSDFKLNNDGLIPVVVQDYKNDQVLMVAYMLSLIHIFLQIAEALQSGLPVEEITYIPGTVYKCKDLSRAFEPIVLPSYEEVSSNKHTYADSFAVQYRNKMCIRDRCSSVFLASFHILAL